jgi:two-component system phosphate regulon sensor histidine kinase PhoR
MLTALIITAVILLTALILLAVQYRKMNTMLHQVVSRIDEIRNGNSNQRIRIYTTQKNFNRLSGSLNLLINEFQSNLETLNLLEAERNKIVSHLSHDLRTPLTSILGYIELIQTNKNLSQAQIERYLSIILSKGNKLDALIRGFFELSKLEEDGGASWKPEKINIIESLKEIILSFHQQLIKAHLTPELCLLKDDIFIWGNKQKLERIMDNLITNIIRYGAAGGRMGIEVEVTESQVWIHVWDNGQGIADTDHPHLFERLYTGQAARNSVHHGNGLGLSIVKKLVEAQHGEIKVSSIPYTKTTFSFSLLKVT